MIEVILQHYGGSGGIEVFLASPPIAFASREPRFGLVTRQSLVLQHDRYVDPLAESLGQHLDFPSQARGTAVEASRPSDDDCGQSVLVFGELLDLVDQQ